LSAAYHLRRRGLRVTLFDMLPEAGGMLRAAIPPYRLPRAVLDAEAGRLLALDIEFRAHQRLGRDVALDELRADYGAVFLAPGNQRGRRWNVDGATPRDLHMGLDLLKQWVALGTVTVTDSVAIVGGGNTAVDLARVLRLAGVRAVHVITHAALPAPGVAAADAMSAIPREIEQALEEGVVFHPHRGIRRLILRGERAVGVELVHMKRLERPGGGEAPVAFEGTETVLHVQQVIPAIGQEVDWRGVESLIGRQPFFAVGPGGELDGYEGVFAGGDARGGAGTVSRAIGDGRRAAAAIDAWLKGEQPGRAGCARTDRARRAQLELFRPRAAHARAATAGGGARRPTRDRRRPGRGSRRPRGRALPVLRQLPELRQLLDPVPRQRRAQDRGAGRRRFDLRFRLRLLQGLRPVRARMPLRLHRDGRRGLKSGLIGPGDHTAIASCMLALVKRVVRALDRTGEFLAFANLRQTQRNAQCQHLVIAQANRAGAYGRQQSLR
jgi:hypothetical protein